MAEQYKAEQLRARVRAMETRGRGRRYPEDLVNAAVAYVTARRAKGITLRAAAREIELSWRTVEHWLHHRRPAREATLRRVTIAPPLRAAPAVTVVTPQGVRVEGLDVEQAAELLKRLG